MSRMTAPTPDLTDEPSPMPPAADSAKTARLGLLVVDHGSRRATANDDLRWISGAIRQLMPTAAVATAHMELADPSIAAGIANLLGQGCKEIVVLPYFLTQGRHIRQDVPELVAAALAEHPSIPFRIAPPLGPGPELAHLLLNRAGLPTSGGELTAN